MLHLRLPLPAILVCLSSLSAAVAQNDYTFMSWADGWRGRDPEGRKILEIQTSSYGVAFDVEKPAILHLGSLTDPPGYATAATQRERVVDALPQAEFRLSATVGGVVYTCVSAAGKQDDMSNFPVRMIESGQFLQRFDILDLIFQDAEGKMLFAKSRLEVVAWPDRLCLLLEMIPIAVSTIGRVKMELMQYGNGMTTDVMMVPGEKLLAWCEWIPNERRPDEQPATRVSATDKAAGNALLRTGYDEEHGWWYVDLPERQWDIAKDPDHLDQFGLCLANESDKFQTLNLLFAYDNSFTGVTGLSPMLRDSAGNPSGIPVQISKNWHRLPDRRFRYEGPWFHGVSRITLAPHETWEGELAIAYARWGGVPAASQAQLCLIGWGTNQLWEQAAIGSWGESICYDPDVNLNRSMIDDVRPLMVTGMKGGQWTWTHNVGGGDFLVYFDDANQKQFLTHVKTARLASGPNLTETIYSGLSADGRIAAQINVSTPRCDDVNRAYHHIRYDVLAPTMFSRLAFYQVGADHYNDHQFTTMARGNASGLLEEWPAEQGGKHYLRPPMPCEGDAPWFSLHGGVRTAGLSEGAWANRGLVIRSWKARLGGQDCPTPHAAVYGTENGVPSASLELVPPPGVTYLQPGDFVEADLELLIVPTSAADYYGPNEALRADLQENANTWKVIQRLATGNELQIAVKKGTVLRRIPVMVAVDADQSAEFTVTGGMNYLPVTLTGLDRASGYVLEHNGEPLSQAVHGNDFWQTVPTENGYAQTYNVSLDSGGPSHPFRFTRKAESAAR